VFQVQALQDPEYRCRALPQLSMVSIINADLNVCVVPLRLGAPSLKLCRVTQGWPGGARGVLVFWGVKGRNFGGGEL